MKKLKYIRTNYCFIVFAEPVQHSEIAKGLEVISAGFVSIVGNPDMSINCACYGESISLKLKSSPEDSEMMTRQFNNQY